MPETFSCGWNFNAPCPGAPVKWDTIFVPQGAELLAASAEPVNNSLSFRAAFSEESAVDGVGATREQIPRNSGSE